MPVSYKYGGQSVFTFTGMLQFAARSPFYDEAPVKAVFFLIISASDSV